MILVLSIIQDYHFQSHWKVHWVHVYSYYILEIGYHSKINVNSDQKSSEIFLKKCFVLLAYYKKGGD